MIFIKDYTEIFSRAIDLADSYDYKKICNIITNDEYYCGESDEWGGCNWLDVSKRFVDSKEKFFGYLNSSYPVALINEYCPQFIRDIFNENNILFTYIEEPMSCDENILKKYTDNKLVFNEDDFVSSDYSYDDERFYYLLWRIETGKKYYIDSGDFTFRELKYA